MPNKTAQLFTDGGSRGNPGPAGIGCFLKIGNEVKKYKEYIGETTNNQAEYKALLAGLDLANENGIDTLEVFLDSELIVKQVQGKYKVKNPDLKPLFAEVLKKTNNFSSISFAHVYREKNKDADKLVNEAIDASL